MNSTGLTTVANVAIATGPAVFCVKCMVYYMQGWISEFRSPRRTLIKGTYILQIQYRNFILWKKVTFFILSGNLLLR